MAAQGATSTAAPPQCACIGDVRALERDIKYTRESLNRYDASVSRYYDRTRAVEKHAAELADRVTDLYYAIGVGAVAIPLASLLFPGVRRPLFSWLSRAKAQMKASVHTSTAPSGTRPLTKTTSRTAGRPSAEV